MIIGISGFIGSGKDTVADYLVQQHDYVRESWAASLKDAVAAVFGWDRSLLEGDTVDGRKWRELPDEWWSKRLGQTITPRTILQKWGTEVCRDGYHDDIWIASAERRLLNNHRNVVISDCRFVNELECIKRLGGITIRIVRGADPVWLNEYLTHGRTYEFAMKYKHVHASEFSSVGWNYDRVLLNNGTLEQLYSSINDLLVGLQVAK